MSFTHSKTGQLFDARVLWPDGGLSSRRCNASPLPLLLPPRVVDNPHHDPCLRQSYPGNAVRALNIKKI